MLLVTTLEPREEKSMKRFLIVTLLLFCAALGVAQTQNAVVKRNTYLREGPSTSDKKIILLKSGDELQLIDPGRPRTITTSAPAMAMKAMRIRECDSKGSAGEDRARNWQLLPVSRRPRLRTIGNEAGTQERQHSMDKRAIAPGTGIIAIPTRSSTRTAPTPQRWTAFSITMLPGRQ